MNNARQALLFSTLSLSAMLTGCNAMNAYSSAALSQADASETGLNANLTKAAQLQLKAVKQQACQVTVGALQGAASSDQRGVLAFCPVNNLLIVNAQEGTVTLAPPAYTLPTPATSPAAQAGVPISATPAIK